MTGYALTETPLGQPLGREATELEPKDGRRRTALGSSNSSRIVLGDRSDDRSPRRRRHSFYLALRSLRSTTQGSRLSHTRNNSTQQQATTHFWREREAANEYFLGVTEAEEEIYAEAKGFDAATESLAADDAAERELVADARAANAAFVATFQQQRGALDQGQAAKLVALDALGAGEEAVLAPLAKLDEISAAEAIKTARPRQTQRQARRSW